MALKFKPMTNSMVEPLFHVATMLKRSVLQCFMEFINNITLKLDFPKVYYFHTCKFVSQLFLT